MVRRRLPERVTVREAEPLEVAETVAVSLELSLSVTLALELALGVLVDDGVAVPLRLTEELELDVRDKEAEEVVLCEKLCVDASVGVTVTLAIEAGLVEAVERRVKLSE